jgi:hypothetical protein
MIPYIIGGVAAVIVLFLIVVATRPANFRITRSASMAASPQAVFAQVNDLHNWEAWSPWAKLDPAAKRTYEGAPVGPGAVFKWAGNNKIGEGAITIVESRPGDFVRIRLEFLKPFKATNLAEFEFKPAGQLTSVNWSMTGTYNFMSKAFGLFVNMDKMVGGDFEKGLANLKAVVEAAPKT